MLVILHVWKTWQKRNENPKEAVRLESYVPNLVGKKEWEKRQFWQMTFWKDKEALRKLDRDVLFCDNACLGVIIQRSSQGGY